MDMKHLCRCGLEKHLQRFRVKKFGALGVVLMGLHVLFHVVECLVLPTVFVALGGHAVEEQAAAASESALVVYTEDGKNEPDFPMNKLVDFRQSLARGLELRL